MTHIKYKILLGFMIYAISCATPKPENNLRIVENNGLSSAEKALGWESLFNGQDMEQWKVYKKEGTEGWAVKDGEMVALGLGSSADIVTKDTYENFELSLEWNIGAEGNSGIFFNVREEAEAPAVYHTGPEYQLIDDSGFEGRIKDSQKSGANYDMHPPKYKATRPAGSWNKSRLIVDEGKVQHWLNGKKVVQYELWTPEWEELKANAKWKDVPTYGKFKSGHIALQDHGNEIRFRNIKIRRL